MEFVLGLLVVVHFVGMAAIVGSWLSTIRTPRVLPAMVYGALTQLVTGILLVGLIESGAVAEEGEGGEELNMVKISVKLVIALVVFALAWFNRKRGDQVPAPIFHAIGGLALLNVMIAVLWT